MAYVSLTIYLLFSQSTKVCLFLATAPPLHVTMKQKCYPITQPTFLLQNPILSMFSKFKLSAIQNRPRCWLFDFFFFKTIRVVCLLYKRQSKQWESIQN